MNEVDIENLKFIPKSEVPSRQYRTKWDELFSSIPKGEALVLPFTKVNKGVVRMALYYRHKKGKFEHLEAVERGEAVYVINSKEVEE